MDYDEINELLKRYINNYNSKDNGDNSKTNDGGTQEQKSSKFNYGFFYTDKNGYGCNDMPGGFQRVNPLLFIVIGNILGDAVAGRLPFNVQNAIGNWIQLVGQAIETYSAQQSYFQSGPGRYYSPNNLNITNSTCPTESSSSTSSNTSQSSSDSSLGRIENMEKIVGGLYTAVKEMKDELENIKQEISCIDKDKNSSNITQ